MLLLSLKLSLLLISNLAILIAITSQLIQQKCPQRCGNFTVPYPFGLEQDCAWDKHFHLFCNHSYNPPRLFLHPGSENDILEISLDGYLKKLTYVARDCYTKTGELNFSTNPYSKVGKFFFSTTQNKFTAVGCDTQATLAGSSASLNSKYISGCMSICYNESNVINGSCSGIGCCQTSIPKELSMFNVSLGSFFGHKDVWKFNPCSYGFISEVGYVFSSSHLNGFGRKIAMVLDWAIGDQGCEDAAKNVTGYACKEMSECRDSDNGPGYRCFCKIGYAGNPYVHNGCVDIDECKNGSLNDCTHKCHNTEGSYTCSCPKWFQGDGRRNGQRCTFYLHKIIHFIIGDVIVLILLALGSLLLHFYRRKRMHHKLKEDFFKQNGGLILLERISRRESGSNSIITIKIFKSEDLEVATNNFNDNRICGHGGFGTVYKGYLPDNTVVAIKKSKIVDQSQIEQFINEITLLSQINHRNVVRFVGCCLETPVPLLVYEFITNGTLSDHIHNNDNNGKPRLLWKTRLKIASETAGVLAYLHVTHSSPIIHRDIKPTNILLDDDYTSKVSDFGASRLIPNNLNQMCTMVQGTLGYLDPEYLQTSELTEKSDVYSFGVVLVEILTGLTAVSFERIEEERSLVKYFLSKDEGMMEIIDKGVTNEDNIEEIIKVVKIAKMCLKVKGDERPNMKEVALELESLVMGLKHKWGDSNEEESENFLGEGFSNHGESSTQMGDHYIYSSKQTHEFLSLVMDDGR